MKTLAAILFILCSIIIIPLGSCRVSDEVTARTGAQLWADHCSRCHNIVTPGEYDDERWEVITDHMRVRANLTPEETDKILQFLKTTN